MKSKETLSSKSTPLVASSPEFPEGVEFLVLDPDGRFREGKQIPDILDRYISRVPSKWINYPMSVKRILYALDRLGFNLEAQSGMVNHYYVYQIRADVDDFQLNLIFSEHGYPEKWVIE